MDSLILNCLGTGDGWPCADRSHSAFLYRFPETAFLIDCGESVSRTVKASGWSYDMIECAFLSHLHFDHLGGFFMLMQGFWLERRRRTLTVHMPEDGIAPVKRLLDAGCVFEDLLSFRLRFRALRARRSVVMRGVEVTPCPTTHLDQLRARFGSKYAQRFESFSFLIDGHGMRVAHSADLGAVGDLSPLLSKPVDLLVCELAHFDVEPLAAYLRDKPIGRVLFVHLARALRQDMKATRKRIRGALGRIPFRIAEDGDRLAVRAGGMEGG
ncbi:MAG TPA: MBL fold metallo-hydrolase [Verrucomicrobiota bacterium]|nr:MBL fold metallo-hydrolase [Verrucomicrobiota bacterium]HRZ57960.1 MBL fold metallo-hydrolase [Candidatus Paceibacterota bacterium]